MRRLLALSDVGLGDRATVGGKAARLAALVAAGFEVPRGVVLPVGMTDEAALPDELAKELPEELAKEIVARFGDVALAVRSSAVAEDGAAASFAGLFETVLGVRGAAALAEAIARCRAAAQSPRVQAYAAGPQPLALLVQEMVLADVAGVAFTANPLTGARGEVVITAARGLGDAIVDGSAGGEQWCVRGEAVTSPSAVGTPNPVLNDARARRISVRPPSASPRAAARCSPALRGWRAASTCCSPSRSERRGPAKSRCVG